MAMDTEKQNKLRDINDIVFGDHIQEIVSSMEILLTLFEINDDKEILDACKSRLREGLLLLKEKGHPENFSEIEDIL